MSKMSLAELLAEVADRKSVLSGLKAKKASLLEGIAKIDKDIKAAGGDIDIKVKAKKADKAKKATKRAKRAKNETSLVETVAKVLASAAQPMRVKDVVLAVEATGYKSNSKSFYSCVATALKLRFKRLDMPVVGLYP
jgi:hypothetical protein